jgi:hypothetical protein
MKRLFIHSSDFDNAWTESGLSDDHLKVFQEELCNNPHIGTVIKGTNGLRKARFSIPGRGKSGGVWVFYLDIPSFDICYLLFSIKKGEKENLTKSEINEIGEIVKRIKDNIKRRYSNEK